jgi:DNA-binding protein H-NS
MALKLDKLSVAQLDDVIAEAQQRKQMANEAKKKGARARIDAILAETGFTLDDLYGVQVRRMASPRSEAGRSNKPPKFRNPDNPKQTWSGYGGRRPRWFDEAINKGVPESALLIASPRKAPAAAKKGRPDTKPRRGARKASKAPKRR